MLEGLAKDFRYAARMLLKKRGFTAIAIVTLGIGIGASTAMFSVIDNVLLNPFPYKHGNQIVALGIHDTSDTHVNDSRRYFQGPEFIDYAEQTHSFQEEIGGANEDVLYTSAAGTQQFDGGVVTPNTFDFLGVPAMIGRNPTPDDVKPGATPVFAMSYKMWVKFFGQDPSIVGRSFVLNEVPTTLVGIMPPRFTKLGTDLWRPVAMDRADPQLANLYFNFQGLLKPGVTPRQAEAELNGIALRLTQVYPKNYPKQFSVHIIPLADSVVGDFRGTLYALAAAVGLLLLIACSNVANMLLAQATAREKEIAIRAAMGASRWRIIRQLLIESFLLALGGAAVGCLFAYGGIKGIVRAIPDGAIPHESVIGLNVPVLLFTLGIAVATAMPFGLVPALQAAKRDIVEPLKDSGRGVSGGFRRGKLRSVLVVVEVALSLVLLAGAGVMMHTFVKLADADLGFDPTNILVARLPFPKGQYTTAAEKQQFFSALLARLYALPGVVAATETSTLPPYGGIGTTVDIPGKVHTDDWRAIFQVCSEGYFPTLGLRLMRGRLLSNVDVNDARKVAVVNQTLVTKYFGTDDPIGREIIINELATLKPDPVVDPTFEIVGVTADEKDSGIQDPIRPEIFIPYTITGAYERGILVRTSRDPMLLLNPVRDQIWAVDRNVALTLTGSLTDYLKQFSYSGPRFSLTLLGIFAGVGLVLVALGVYSVTAYTVSRQTHEIGIRMALGAGRANVLRMVMWMGLQLVALGVGVGLLASWGATRAIASQLWNVSPHDPVTLGGVTAVLLVVGCAACYFPARRATRVDPMVALRYE
ncbi:MAG: ABC transporter permease [Candidatus Acidiferrales bacterium]